MSLTLEAIRILDTIDCKGSFGAAAIALDRVPSALTYSIRNAMISLLQFLKV